MITDINISFTQDITNIRLIFSWCGYYFSYVFMILLWQTVYILLTWQKIYFLYTKDWFCIYVWFIFMDFMIFGKFLVEVHFEERAPKIFILNKRAVPTSRFVWKSESEADLQLPLELKLVREKGRLCCSSEKTETLRMNVLFWFNYVK